jgi:hypothetical protein
MIKIIENIITPSYANAIEADVATFPWRYLDDITYDGNSANPGFVNVIYEHNNAVSEWYPFIKPLVFQIADAIGVTIFKLLRIRVGFLLPGSEPAKPATPHVDFFQPHYTACYYINDSDGDTVVYDQRLDAVEGQEINQDVVQDYVRKTKFTIAQTSVPRKGSVCVFDGKHFHSITAPFEYKKRFVLTVNWM